VALSCAGLDAGDPLREGRPNRINRIGSHPNDYLSKPVNLKKRMGMIEAQLRASTPRRNDGQWKEI
jgi:hypothetical protein